MLVARLTVPRQVCDVESKAKAPAVVGSAPAMTGARNPLELVRLEKLMVAPPVAVREDEPESVICAPVLFPVWIPLKGTVAAATAVLQAKTPVLNWRTEQGEGNAANVGRSRSRQFDALLS